MPMSYCNTCQSTQNSTNWDSNRCLKCGNTFNAMAITTGSQRNTTALSLMANSASSEVKNAVSEANRSGSSVEYRHAEGNLASGNYKAETMDYNSNS